MIAMLLSVALAGAAVDDESAASPKRYTPEIRGQLLDGTRPVSSNVCLRQSGSEIRMCGYTDFSGNFYIPTHSVRPKPGDTGALSWWLEIGRVTEARRIAPIDASEKNGVSIVLACNLARSTAKSDTTSLCDRKSSAAPNRVTQSEPTRRPTVAHPGK